MSMIARARRLRVALGALALTLLVLGVQPAGAVSPNLVVSQRYSCVFEGNLQVLDQILVSTRGLGRPRPAYDAVHVNSEFADAFQTSDHEPVVRRFGP